MYDQYTGGSLVGIMQHHHHHLPHQQHQQHQQPQHHNPQQQHPHQQQQQQQQQFMPNTEQWLPDDGQDEFMPKIVQRRAKRIIPDTEKDDKYWEKRKRNNMAAKRSRENKRLMENDIRQKVSSLEEQNALLRKEVALIKTRYGIPADQSFLTPEERAQCMQEVKNAQEERNALAQNEKTGSPDGVSSTSSGVYPVCMHQVGDEEDDERRSSLDGSNSSPKVKDEDFPNGAGGGGRSGDNGYGPSAYGPFNPSPCWGPTGSAPGMQGYGNSNTNENGSNNNANFSPPVGTQAKLPPISNAFHEKSNSPYVRYINNSIGAYSRPPYDYFMQYSSQHNPMLYGTEEDVNQSGIAPADLSTSRNKRQDERMPGRVGMRNMIGSKNSDLNDSVAHSIPHTVQGSIDLDDVNVMNSNMGQVPRSQDHFLPTRTMGLPIQQTASSSNHGQSLPTETAHTASNAGIGGPEQENLKRENDALKIAVRTLTAQVEHMKDQVYKD